MGLPVCRCELSWHGDFPDLSGVLSGNRISGEKLAAHGSSYRGAVCAAGLVVFPVWSAVFLADVSAYGGDHHRSGIFVLPAVFKKGKAVDFEEGLTEGAELLETINVEKRRLS